MRRNLGNLPPNTEDLSCPLGHTCSRCLLYRCMSVDVENPTTGEKYPGGQVWDCAFAWNMLGAWDAGRQMLGAHAAIVEQTNQTTKRQDEFLSLVQGARAPERIDHAPNKNQ